MLVGCAGLCPDSLWELKRSSRTPSSDRGPISKEREERGGKQRERGPGASKPRGENDASCIMDIVGGEEKIL